MTQNNGNGQQGFFNLDGHELTVVDKVTTGKACMISQNITKEKIKPYHFRQQARNGKVEIPYYQGMLIAEIVDISPSNRRYWSIKLRPNTLFPPAA